MMARSPSGTVGHSLFKINGTSGATVWRQQFDGAVQTATIAVTSPFFAKNRTLYVPNSNLMVAIDSGTRAELWRFVHPHVYETCRTAVFSDFYYYFTGVYFTCGSSLYFANAVAGRIEWNFTVPASEGFLSAPAVSLVKGIAFVGSNKVWLFCCLFWLFLQVRLP